MIGALSNVDILPSPDEVFRQCFSIQRVSSRQSKFFNYLGFCLKKCRLFCRQMIKSTCYLADLN